MENWLDLNQARHTVGDISSKICRAFKQILNESKPIASKIIGYPRAIFILEG